VHPVNARHDYEIIKKCGFIKIVLDIGGKPEIIENPKYSICIHDRKS